MSRSREEGDESVDDLFAPLDGEAGPARRISRQKSAALVLAALEAGTPETPPRPRVGGKLPPVWLMAGAVLFAGAAAATAWSLARPASTEEPQVTTSIPETPRAERDSAPGVGSEPTEDSARPVEAEPPVPAQAVGSAPPASAPPRVARPPAPAPSEASPRDDAAPVVRQPRPEAPARIPPDAEPEDLLRKANELRAVGRWKEAEALYLHVIRAQPSSLASYVARVASGSLRLEHLGNARGALRQFQEALRIQPHGVLGQEARHGIAEAWRALGDREAEARALEEFLAIHPDSPLGTTARTRLGELSGP
ncbi:tetratricopeptide repeat protein [Pyxidicoccus trucidator]|uniref:tetratricopeptide repeat protein n=1 Tax=Pyxidicoccus trucidator TaxID=2709662 RepID=UPI0013DB9DDB|nr:tetratricopeptide repeat protein [Pyxidicoccus trucidator]